MNEMIQQQTAEEMVPLNEAKVVFLGDGGAGKSHILARLMNDGAEPLDYQGESTPGIAICDKTYDLDGRQVKIHFWDFGGQEILHSMHQIFLTERTMYVVVVNVRDGMQEERARYWLNNVSCYAPDAQVILVLNQNDQNINARVNDRSLINMFPNLKRIIGMSALKLSRESFNREFEGALLEQISRSGLLDTVWPAQWFEVKHALQEMNAYYIPLDKYRQVCMRFGVLSSHKELLNWFHTLGICTYFDEIGDAVVLRPDWITNALYIILFNHLDREKNGLIPHETIFNLLKNAYNNPHIRCTLPQVRYAHGDIRYILGVMRKFNLSFTDGWDNEFIPMLCPPNSSVDIRFYERDPETLEFRMEFVYLPENLLHRLMLERHTELDMANVWRKGARLQLPKIGLSAVVVIDENTLKFFIRHTDPMHRPSTYLTMLKEHVKRLSIGMSLSAPIQHIVYKKDGKKEVFDYEELEFMLEDGHDQVFSKVFRKMISIEDILNQASSDAYNTKKLEEDITRASTILQKIQLPCRESEINLHLKLLLREKGYTIADPALLMADSFTGKHRGEPDILLVDERQNLMTVIEAMNIREGTASIRNWDDHLAKLLHHYNTWELSPLFLICYVDCEQEAYANLWGRYRDHMRRYAPDRSELLYESYTEMMTEYSFLRIVSCRYLVNGKDIKVYHYFVRVVTTDSKDIPLEHHTPVEELRKLWSMNPSEQAEPPIQLQPVEQPETAAELELAEQPAEEAGSPKQAEVILHDYRVVFLGDSEAGKTLILSRLDNPEMDPKDFHDNTTIGINILRKKENINGQPVRVNYWDFGGQDILHSMHRIFLAKNTLYVIVLNTRNDNQDAQAIFWLRYVEAYAPGSPVLLVMNKTDQNKRAALNLPVLNRLFSNRKFAQEDVLKISAVCPEKEEFQKQFTKKLHECIGRYFGAAKPFTSQETQIRDKVEAKKAADKLKVISIDDFRDICEEESLDDEDAQDALMERFNETGVLVYFQGKTLMFMNPEWITKTIYKILDQDEQIADNGVVLHKKIKSFCRKNEDNINKSEDAAHLLDIMRDYDLSFWYEKQKPGEEHTEDKEFIPMLCQREEPHDIAELIRTEKTVEMRMVFEYLPCGVLYKLMVDYHGQLDMDHVWLTGMKLDHENGSYAVVRQEGNAMGIYVHDINMSRGIEWMIRLKDQAQEAAKHDKFHALLLETKIAYRISGVKEYFDYQQLKNAEESGLYYTVSRSRPPQKVAIRDVLAQKDGTVSEYIRQLLKLTSAGCQELQKQHTYWFLAKDARDDRTHPKMDEDARTEVIRMKLSSAFTVKPQPRAGDSSTGKKQGELDLRIELDECTTMAILEALNITGYSTETQEYKLADLGSFTRWREHLERVVCDYNKEGIKNLLLVSYLDCPVEQTVQTREKYFERLKNHVIPNFGSPEYCEPIVVDEFTDGIHVVRADYSSGAGSVTVYHFLVRIEQYGRKGIS